MLQTILLIVLLIVSTAACSQRIETDPKTINAGDHPSKIIWSKGKTPGTAELYIEHLGQNQNRPAGTLYCLANIGHGWPELGSDKPNQKMFDIKSMQCAAPQGKSVRIVYNLPNWQNVAPRTYGYVPMTVYPDGRLYAWEQYPAESPTFKSYQRNMQAPIIALHIPADGYVRLATKEEAMKDLRD